MIDPWLELPVAGDRKAYFSASAIVGVEATFYDKAATPDAPMTIHLRGGHAIENVIGLRPLQVIGWLKVCARKEIELTTFDQFWDAMNKAYSDETARVVDAAQLGG